MADEPEKPRGDVIQLFHEPPVDLLGGPAEEEAPHEAEKSALRSPYTPPVAYVVPIPPPDADMDVWRDHAHKSLLAVALSPKGRAALEEGLTAPDLRERRLWWQQIMGPLVRPPDTSGGAGGPGGVRITFNQQTPAPPHEEGPLVDVTPPKR